MLRHHDNNNNNICVEGGVGVGEGLHFDCGDASCPSGLDRRWWCYVIDVTRPGSIHQWRRNRSNPGHSVCHPRHPHPPLAPTTPRPLGCNDTAILTRSPPSARLIWQPRPLSGRGVKRERTPSDGPGRLGRRTCLSSGASLHSPSLSIHLCWVLIGRLPFAGIFRGALNISSMCCF